MEVIAAGQASQAGGCWGTELKIVSIKSKRDLELKELPRLLLDMEKDDSFELYMLEITFLVSLMVSTDRSDVMVLKNTFCTLGSLFSFLSLD